MIDVLVRMEVEISGTRDGVLWPGVGAVVDLPDAEAMDMLNAKLVSPVEDEPETETAAMADDAEKTDEKPAPKKRASGLTKKSTGLGG